MRIFNNTKKIIYFNEFKDRTCLDTCMVRDINMGTMVTTNASVFGSLTVVLTDGISVMSVLEDRTNKCHNTNKNKKPQLIFLYNNIG